MSENQTAYEIDVLIPGAEKIDAAARSMETLAVLQTDANKAVQAAEAAYRKAETTADRMAKAIERIGVAADAQRGKLQIASDLGDTGGAEKAAARLRVLTQRQADLAAKAAQAKAELGQQAATVDKAKDAVDRIGKAIKNLEGGEIRFEALKRGLNKIGGPLADAGGKVAELAAGFQKLGKVLGTAGPYVAIAVFLTAIVAGLAAVAAAAVVAAAKMVEFAVSLADVNRTNLLLEQGIARSAQGGALLDAKIDSLTRRLPATREELLSMAKGLGDAGLRGKELTDYLERSATWAARVKFGPNFEQQMLSLSEQSKVFQLNLQRTFGGLKIDGLLGALQKMIGLLDASTESGNAIKVVFESFFQPIIDGLTNAEPKIERFFLNLEILALRALIAIKPWGSTIEDVGKSFLVVLAILVAPFILLIGLIVAANAAVLGLLTGVVFLAGKLIRVGVDIVEGLVEGIVTAGPKVLEALKGVVTSAVDGVKHLLGIHSPSTVFAEIGDNTAEGMAIGVTRSSGGVRSALEGMSSPTVVDGTPTGQSTVTTSTSGHTVSGNTFQFYGVKDADDAESRFGTFLTRLLEGDATQLAGA